MTAILHVHRPHMRAMLAVGMTACKFWYHADRVSHAVDSGGISHATGSDSTAGL
jgi:hypothetical protein